mgnify:CR=1 FL=1
MNLEKVGSDFYINNYFDNQVKNFGIECGENILENGVPKDLDLTTFEAVVCFRKAEHIVNLSKKGRSLALSNTLNFLGTISHSFVLEARFHPGFHIDFSDHPIPNRIPFDGPDYLADYSYG